MTHENVDPRIDKMIAALYGELSESEERAFRRLLEKDAALRAEWEELSGSRKVLAGWSVEERVPSFVLIEDERQAPAPAPAAGGLLARIGDVLRSLGPGPVWGLATAAAAFIAFVLADLRFQGRLERELAARDAAVAPAPAVAERDALPQLGTGRPIEPAADAGEMLRVGSDTQYLTPSDLQNYNGELMTVLVDLLNQYDARRADEVNGLVQALYERINRQQVFDYRQINNRIDAVGAELLLEKDRHERALDELLGPVRKAETPASGSEE
jgi:hypothetical protein